MKKRGASKTTTRPSSDQNELKKTDTQLNFPDLISTHLSSGDR